MRPTEMAEINLDLAFNFAQGTNPTLFDVTGVLNQLAQGLSSMKRGLRATYMKLEEIEQEIKLSRVSQR
jgi:hypothetical protein